MHGRGGLDKMKTIKINFVDCWAGHKPEEDKYYKILSKFYHVEISDSPDYVFCGSQGHRQVYLNDCIKIQTIGENIVPDFNSFDYAIGFDELSFGDRYLRLPLFYFYDEFSKLSERGTVPSREELLNRKFCSFVVSNGGGDPLRTKFFYELSKYKQVDSGGRYLNNVGGPVANKEAFCKGYKFNIAFENSVSPGYTTEKVMQPLTYHSVPIYYGNPNVTEDFTDACMVRIKDESDVSRAIEEIKYLDTHDEAYLEKCLTPRLTHGSEAYYDARIEAFLRNIFDRPLNEARRLIPYGMQNVYRGRLRHLYKLDDAWKAPLRALNRMRRKFF